jgi:hypothetical protein
MHVDRSEGEKVILKVLLALSFSVVPYQLYAPPRVSTLTTVVGLAAKRGLLRSMGFVDGAYGCVSPE